MARSIAFLAMALLVVTVSAARFSDTKNSLVTTSRAFTKKELNAATRGLKSVKFGSKAQIVAAQKAKLAANKASKAVRKELSKAKKALRQANNKVKNLTRKAKNAKSPKAKNAAKAAAKNAAAIVPGLEKAVLRLTATELKSKQHIEEAKAHLKKMLQKRPNKKVRINGGLVPSICYCARYPAGEGSCFGFTNGKYCEARPCEAKHVCTTKAKSGGAVCFLRHITSRVVSTGGGKCARQAADGYMFVPYWTHEEK